AGHDCRPAAPLLEPNWAGVLPTENPMDRLPCGDCGRSSLCRAGGRQQHMGHHRECSDCSVSNRRIRGDAGTAHAYAENRMASHSTGTSGAHCVDELPGTVDGGDRPLHRRWLRACRPGVSATADCARVCRLRRAGCSECVVVEASPLRPGRIPAAVVHHVASTDPSADRYTSELTNFCVVGWHLVVRASQPSSLINLECRGKRRELTSVHT